MKVRLFWLGLFGPLIWWLTAVWLGGYPLFKVTPDDASYLQTIENLWRANDAVDSPSFFVQRPPLHGAFLMLMKLAFGDCSRFAVLIFAALLHGFSTVLLDKTIPTNRFKKFSIWVFALCPVYFGFIQFELSEIWFPFILTAWMYVSLQKGKKHLLPLVYAFTYLLRPQLLLIFLPQILAIAFKKLRHFPAPVSLKGLFSWLVLAISLVSWEGYKIYRTNHILEVHPIYHEANQTVFRPTHEALTNVFRTFEYHSGRFHFWEEQARLGTVHTDSLKAYAQLKQVPYERLADVLREYGICQRYVQVQIKHSQVQTLLPIETDFIKSAHEVQNHREHSTSIGHYISLRGKILSELFGKTHLHFDAFRINNWRSLPFKLMTVLMLITTVVVLLILGWRTLSTRFVWAGVGLYLIYLLEIQILVEERYAYPILILSLIIFPSLLETVFKKKVER